jgi:dihydrofolate reductase
MRKIILHLHTSLDGFVAGPNGEMDWIRLDDQMFDLVGQLTGEADTALYGRVTWQMMDRYWPTAADKPNPSRHDMEHSAWYNRVDKVVLSRTMHGKDSGRTRFIGKDIAREITELKNQPGGNIQIFGSPGAARSLMEHSLIDEYWLFINPVILGKGIPAFSNITEKVNLAHLETTVFPCGVTGVHYKAPPHEIHVRKIEE